MATLTLRPNEAGDETNLAPYPNTGEANWEDVCEEAADEDDTYVSKTLGTASDAYGLSAPSGSGTINFITVYFRCKMVSGVMGTARARIITGGSGYISTSVQPTSDYVTYSKQWIKNPQTDAAWTWDGINALQAGVYIAATYDDIRCTQVYVEVDYRPPEEYERLSSVLIGVAVPTGTDWAGTVTVYVGVKSTASRLIGFIRQSQTAIGNLVSASRTLALVRKASVVIGNLVSALRIRAYSVLSSIAIGLKVSSSRIGGFIKTASIAIGLKVTGGFLGRLLKVKVITSQYRNIKALTSQYRIIKTITAQYRQLKVFTTQNRIIKTITTMYRKVKGFTGG